METLKQFLDGVEFRLKRNLFPGEELKHRHLGDVVYTEACAAMEERDGHYDTIYIEHAGEIKEVTLTLIERDTFDGIVKRMQELTPELRDLIVRARFIADRTNMLDITLEENGSIAKAINDRLHKFD